MRLKSRVYITEAGAVSAAGNGAEEFFRTLSSCKSGIGMLKRAATDKLRTKIGGECRLETLIESLGFDTLDSPPLAESLALYDNPKLLFALNCIKQIFDSGAFNNINARNVKLFTGAGLEEIKVSALMEPPESGACVCREPPAAFLAEILSRFFKFGVPPATMVSACSASTMAIGEAYRNIKSGALDFAVAGGTDSMLSDFAVNAFNSIGALSEDNSAPGKSIRPFDKSRSGTILGEGAAYFLIESERGLKISGNLPVAEIAGYASSLDAYNPVQPDPGGLGAALAMAGALKDAGMTPEEIDYINAHGTATAHNDAAETAAIKKVFLQAARSVKVGSTKPYFGHLVSAAGAIEILSVLYAFQNGCPPTLNFTHPGEGCDLDYARESDTKKSVRAALKNSFGLNGQNASIILKKTNG